MAAADNLDMSAAGDITSYSVTSLPFDVTWSEGFSANAATIEQDSCHCPAGGSVILHTRFTTDTECTDVVNSSCLSSDGLGINAVCSSLASDTLTVTEPYYRNSTNAACSAASTSPVSCSDSALLFADNISRPVSSVSPAVEDFFPAANGIHVVNFWQNSERRSKLLLHGTH